MNNWEFIALLGMFILMYLVFFLIAIGAFRLLEDSLVQQFTLFRELMKAEFASFRNEMKAEFASFRAELSTKRETETPHIEIR